MRQELQSRLNRAAVTLMAEIDPDNGLFEHLVATEVLTDAQVETCKAQGTRAQRVDAIMSLLKRQPDDSFTKFCDALSAIHRKDLCDQLKQLPVNNDAIEPPGNPIPAGNGNVPNPPPIPPMSFEVAFDGKWDDITAKLSLGSGLVTKLRDFKLLTKADTDEINQPMKTNAQKIECLLGKLELRDPSEFPLFVTALQKSNQPHILKLLNTQ